MNITTVLVALIVGCTAITIFSLMALLYVRRRERERENKTIVELDTALNTALSEINKLGTLVQKEVEEKYKAVLFLYNLVEDKQKEIEESTDSKVISEMIAGFVQAHSTELRNIGTPVASEISEVYEKPKVKKTKKVNRPQITNPKHKKIWEKREQGQEVSEIAKELNMGQGEVKLILDLYSM